MWRSSYICHYIYIYKYIFVLNKKNIFVYTYINLYMYTYIYIHVYQHQKKVDGDEDKSACGDPRSTGSSVLLKQVVEDNVDVSMLAEECESHEQGY